jgi:hypothetical protein
MVHEVGSQQAIWYHSTGGPTQGRQYEVVIQPKRFDSRGIEKHYFICDISPNRFGKLKAAAQRTPPMNCQQWVVDVLRDLEVRSGLVPQGTSNLAVTLERYCWPIPPSLGEIQK